MGKTRVYELAQKLGLDNKVLLEKLQQAGVDAKNHMSVLEEHELEKFETASTPSVEKVEEERITPGIIRRRRKEVAPPAAAAEEPPAEEKAAVAAPPTSEEMPVQAPPVVAAPAKPPQEAAVV